MVESKDWSEERAERAKQLFLAGSSGSEIAAELGGGLTRSAVMGKLARMGVKRPRKKPEHGKAKKRPALPKSARQVKVKAPVLPVDATVTALAPVPIGEVGVVRAIEFFRRGTCLAPNGDPGSEDFRFCGQPCEGPYCSFHASRFLQAPARRRRSG